MSRFAESERMLLRLRKVLVAVSGGQDSLACLLVLCRLSEEFGFEVVACHFDHQLRPGSADDMAAVRALCATLDVPCRTGEGDVRRLALESKSGVEEAARRMRYQFLAFMAEHEGADAVATGHTADDQAETVLMRVLRGTGVRGIRGMLPVTTVPDGGAVKLIRPLLGLRREETAAICAEAGIMPIVDPTNADLRLHRNRLRHETLASLTAINPSVSTALINLAASARQAHEGIERESFSAQPMERGADGSIFETRTLRRLGNEALILVLERESAFHRLEPTVNRTRVSNLRSCLTTGAGQVSFGAAVVEVSSGQVRVGKPRRPVPVVESRVLNVPGSTLAGGGRVDVSTTPFADGTANVTAVSVRGLNGALRVRSILPGDRIQAGGHERKLSDLLINAKVPRWRRLSLLAVADGERVVAVLGVAGGDGPSPGGDDCLYIRFTPLK